MDALSREDLQTLARVGFLAGASGNADAVQKIVAALELARPTAALPYVVQAMALLHQGDPDEAVLALDRGLAVQGQQDTGDLHAYRAFALYAAKRTGEARRELALAGDHPVAIEMTKALGPE
jgi:hypothetical protein